MVHDLRGLSQKAEYPRFYSFFMATPEEGKIFFDQHWPEARAVSDAAKKFLYGLWRPPARRLTRCSASRSGPATFALFAKGNFVGKTDRRSVDHARRIPGSWPGHPLDASFRTPGRSPRLVEDSRPHSQHVTLKTASPPRWARFDQARPFPANACNDLKPHPKTARADKFPVRC